MPKPTKFYDVLVNGVSVFHGHFSLAKAAYVAVRKALEGIDPSAIVTLSFVPDF